MDRIFFHGWWDLLQVLITVVCAYVALIILLRGFGKRSLSAMNAFDFVVTVAFGSTLATTVLNREVSLAAGLVAFASLLALQSAVTWSSVRLPSIRRLVTGDPTLLYYRGRFLANALRRERVNEQEIHAAVRCQGIADMTAVEAVVLETDGSFTVVSREEMVKQPSLAGVKGFSPPNQLSG